jgi:hypothetical protein
MSPGSAGDVDATAGAFLPAVASLVSDRRHWWEWQAVFCCISFGSVQAVPCAAVSEFDGDYLPCVAVHCAQPVCSAGSFPAATVRTVPCRASSCLSHCGHIEQLQNCHRWSAHPLHCLHLCACQWLASGDASCSCAQSVPACAAQLACMPFCCHIRVHSTLCHSTPPAKISTRS